jgi:SNF2 family DNA or RNA helicase
VLRERARDFEGGRILLCSGFENTFTTGIIPMLDRMGITHRFLKGTQDTTASIIRDFKAGRVRVLLVNPNNYGSGLNCEMTTDVILMHKFRSEVEKQVVGRAQRVGRTAPLNVWSILYENEA